MSYSYWIDATDPTISLLLDIDKDIIDKDYRLNYRQLLKSIEIFVENSDTWEVLKYKTFFSTLNYVQKRYSPEKEYKRQVENQQKIEKAATDNYIYQRRR
jgi:hypothetical protein